jgi:HD-GYP domain-containing protein (c-di-GMP phosphodiesterase class II)
MVKTHSKLSYDMIKRIDFPWPIAEIVLQHHERINGSGYPQGIKDKDMRLEAKILAVADVVEAMSSHRPYRPALGIGKAIEEINKGKGKLYDADVVDACNRVIKSKNFKFETDFRTIL